MIWTMIWLPLELVCEWRQVWSWGKGIVRRSNVYGLLKDLSTLKKIAV